MSQASRIWTSVERRLLAMLRGKGRSQSARGITMSTVKKYQGDGFTDYELFDSGILRGRMRLDHLNGDITFTPKALSHIWVSPEDQQAWEGLVEHMRKFQPGQTQVSEAAFSLR